MKKFAAFLFNLLLFILMLFGIGMVVAIIGSYLNIVFKLKFEAPPLLYILAALWLVSSIVLYFLPKRKYGILPGSAILFAGESGRFRSLGFYGAVMAGLVAAYVGAVAVNSAVFGRLVAEQEKALAASGVSLDWRGYYPDFPFTDPDNAAPLLEKAGKGFGPDSSKETDRLWGLVTGEKAYDRSKTAGEIARLRAAASGQLAPFEKALGRRKLLWRDYRSMTEQAFVETTMPQYGTMRTYARLEMLGAVVNAGKGDWKAARRDISLIIALSDLLKQDPTVTGTAARIALLNTVLDGIMVSAKWSPDAGAALAFARQTVQDLPAVTGDMGRALSFEYASIAAVLKSMAGDAWLMLDLYVGKNIGNKKLKQIVFSWYYRCFNNWDRYVLLRTMLHHARIAGERDPLQRMKFREELDVFVADRYRLSALMTVVYTPNFIDYVERELLVGARKDVCLLFAAALDHKRRHGRYPESLDRLMPDYMPNLPTNPLDGKPYGYRTAGNFVEVYAEDLEGKQLPTPSFTGRKPE